MTRCLIRFADDILFLAHSQSDIRKMIAHLRDEAEKSGLKLHMGKTKVLTNVLSPSSSLSVGSDEIDILSHQSERYIGRKLCLPEYQENRLAN